MNADLERVLEAALKLPREARAALAGTLLESLEEVVDPDAEAEWAKEIERRVLELESGSATPVSWSDVRRRLRESMDR